MTQEERWIAKYNEVVEFIQSNHRNPSRHRIEDNDMLNWVKANASLELRRYGVTEQAAWLRTYGNTEPRRDGLTEPKIDGDTEIRKNGTTDSDSVNS